MKISTIETGLFKLDGGAMFGVVPRKMWEKLNPPDENNMCTWSMRCLLVEDGEKKILIDTGMGNKQGEKFRSHFLPHGEDALLGSLKDKGVTPEEITDVLLTHLHFDHVGGALFLDDDGNPMPTFPNAKYWTNEPHWKWALNPNPREKASFLKENLLPLEEHGVLHFIDFGDSDEVIWNGITLRLLYGHTHAMMMPIIPYQDSKLVYCADLMPSMHHIGLPYIISFDVRPLESLKEKTRLLEEAVVGKWTLCFEHDAQNIACKVIKNEKGRIVAGERVLI
ncbi:MAG: MBL fold metallo-hydrolase [Saprospiraceae bacterium]